MSARRMRTCFATLICLLCAGYYGVVAFVPRWLAGRVAGWPVSIVGVIAIFVVFCVLTVVYASRGHEAAR